MRGEQDASRGDRAPAAGLRVSGHGSRGVGGEQRPDSALKLLLRASAQRPRAHSERLWRVCGVSVECVVESLWSVCHTVALCSTPEHLPPLIFIGKRSFPIALARGRRRVPDLSGRRTELHAAQQLAPAVEAPSLAPSGLGFCRDYAGPSHRTMVTGTRPHHGQKDDAERRDKTPRSVQSPSTSLGWPLIPDAAPSRVRWGQGDRAEGSGGNTGITAHSRHRGHS